MVVLLRERLQARALPRQDILLRVSPAPLALQEASPEVSLVEDSFLARNSSRVLGRRDSKWACRDSKWASQASTHKRDSLANSTKPAFPASQASNPRFPVSSLSREVSLGSRVSRHSLVALLGSKDSSQCLDNLDQVQASTHPNKAGLVVLELEQPQVQAMALALLGLKAFSKRLR